MFERSFENLNFWVQVLKTILKKHVASKCRNVATEVSQISTIQTTQQYLRGYANVTYSELIFSGMYMCIPVTSNYISSFMMSYDFSYNGENSTGLMSSYFNGNYIYTLKQIEITTMGNKIDGALTVENHQIKIFWAYNYRPNNDDLFHCCYTYYR